LAVVVRSCPTPRPISSPLPSSQLAWPTASAKPTFLSVPPDFDAMSVAEQDAVLDGMIDQLAVEQGTRSLGIS
jgi:hypothetical protein